MNKIDEEDAALDGGLSGALFHGWQDNVLTDSVKQRLKAGWALS